MVTPGWFLRMCLDSRVGERAGRAMNGRGRGEKKKKEKMIVQRGCQQDV